MVKKTFPLVVVLFLAMGITVHAEAEPYSMTPTPVLSFDGTTAVCSVRCYGDKSTDQIEASLTLSQGSEVVGYWSDSGTFSVDMSGKCQAESGKTYRLLLTWSVNGKSQQSKSVTATCP